MRQIFEIYEGLIKSHTPYLLEPINYFIRDKTLCEFHQKIRAKNLYVRDIRLNR